MNLELHLQIAGCLQLLLAMAHLVFPRLFRWREELDNVSLFTRQVFWVHTGFIALVVAGFGLLSVACSDELLELNALAFAILGGLAVFWLARWFCQFFVYSPALWQGNRFNTMMHICFSLLWTYLVAVYAIAFAGQL